MCVPLWFHVLSCNSCNSWQVFPWSILSPASSRDFHVAGRCQSHSCRLDPGGCRQSSLRARQSALRCNQLRTDVCDTAGEGPGGVMGLQFSQVAYVADVVADAILLDISPAH